MNPVPDEPKPMPALDENRRTSANLSPQGPVDLEDEAPDAVFTPEGDEESVPGIPPSATDPK